MLTNILQQQFEAFERLSSGKLGICAQHIETNQQVHFNSDQHFLMCSTDKLPIAIFLLHQVEQNKVNLTDLYEFTEFDYCPGTASILNELEFNASTSLSIQNLLKFMLQDSCNSSADILLRLSGGPAAVNQYLREINIADMHIAGYNLEAIAVWDGIKDLPPNFRVTRAQYQELERKVVPEDVSKARAIFTETIKDTATPTAMTQLLIELFNKQLLNREHTELLLRLMRRCKTGAQRLMGLLPQGSVVAHKTGTLTGFVCDVGIITLPHNRGNIAISGYIRDSSKDLTGNERIIAEVARTIYDVFLYGL